MLRNDATSPVIPLYNDLLFRLILSVVAAHFIISFGEPETLFQLLVMPYYYVSLAGSALIAFLLISLVRYISIRLDRNFDWKEKTVQRIGLQLSLAIILPLIAAFLLAYFYFRYFGMNIHDTKYLRFDYPIISLFIVMLNMYYVTFYFYKRFEQVASIPIPLTIHPEITPEDNTAEKTPGTFVVSKGTKNIALPVQKISYFYHEGSFNFVRSIDAEDFMIPHTLDEVEKTIPDELFFRANRKLIVNKNACQYFEPMEYNKLKLVVDPPFKEPVVISQKRSRNFKEWYGSS